MPDKDLELAIRLRADVDKAIKDFRRGAAGIREQGKAAKEASRGTDAMASSMRDLVRFVGAYISLRTVTHLLREADAWNALQTRIKTATKTTGDYVGVSRELYRITRENGTQMETTVSLFQSLARSATELGATNDEMLALTRSVQQLGIISGASQAAMSAGLLQFSQGLSAGIFRAEEFNSIVENLPEVANRIAKGMGITVGELRKAVLDGRILSRDVFQALLRQAPEIAREFESIPANLARSSQSLDTAVDNFLSKLDRATGLSKTLSSMLQQAAGWLDSFSDDPLSAAQGELTGIEERIKRLRASRDAADSTWIDALIPDGLALNKLAALERDAARLRDRIRELKMEAGDTGFPGVQAGVAANDIIGSIWGQPIQKEEIEKRAKATAELASAAIEAETRLTRDALERQQQDLDAQLEQHLISYRDFYARRRQLAGAEVDAEIRLVQGQMVEQRKLLEATEGDEQRAGILANLQKLEADLIILQRRRGEVGTQAARDLAEAERELAGELESVRMRLLQAQGQGAQARRLALEREFRALLTRLGAEGDEAGEAIVRKLIDVEGARAQLQELHAEYDLALQRMSTAEQGIQTRREAGLLGEISGRREAIELYRRTAAEVEALIPRMRALAEATGDPRAVEGVRRLEAEVERLATATDGAAQRINDSIEGGLSDFFADVATGAKSAGDAFEDFGRRVLDTIARIAAERLAEQLFNFVGGSSIGSLLAGVLHTGGIGSAPPATRAVSPLTFVGAPRYHSGNADRLLGLRANEVPAIIRDDEEVLARSDPRHVLNGGATATQQTLQVSVHPDALRMTLGDWLEGELARVVATR